MFRPSGLITKTAVHPQNAHFDVTSHGLVHKGCNRLDPSEYVIHCFTPKQSVGNVFTTETIVNIDIENICELEKMLLVASFTNDSTTAVASEFAPSFFVVKNIYVLQNSKRKCMLYPESQWLIHNAGIPYADHVSSTAEAFIGQTVSSLSMQPAYTNATTFACNSVAAGATGYIYLPVITPMEQGQVQMANIREPLTIQFVFATAASTRNTYADTPVTCTDIKLWVYDRRYKADALADVVMERRPKTYGYVDVVREVFTKVCVAATEITDIVPTSWTNKRAAFVAIGARATAATANDMTTFVYLTDATIVDPSGHPISYQQLPYQLQQMHNRQLLGNPHFADKIPLTWFVWTDDFKKTVVDGEFRGWFQFGNNFKLNITPSGTATYDIIILTGIYRHMVVQNEELVFMDS